MRSGQATHKLTGSLGLVFGICGGDDLLGVMFRLIVGDASARYKMMVTIRLLPKNVPPSNLR